MQAIFAATVGVIVFFFGYSSGKEHVCVQQHLQCAQDYR